MSNWKAAGPDHVQGFWFKKATTTSLHPKLKYIVCECWTSTYMDDRRTHSTHHERQEQRNSCRKLQTNYLPSTDVETVNKYILRTLYHHHHHISLLGLFKNHLKVSLCIECF